MDNLFQLLIFLFVIYSIFSAITKKKAEENKSKNSETSTGDVITETSPEDPIDVLDDVFAYRLPKTGNEYPNQKINVRKGNVLEPKPDLILPVSSTAQQSEKMLNDAGNQMSLEQSTAYESILSQSSRTTELIKKLKNPETIKELILFSEILNKPKALRR